MDGGVERVDEAIERLRSESPPDCHARGRDETQDGENTKTQKSPLPGPARYQKPKRPLERALTGLDSRFLRRRSSSNEDLTLGQSLQARFHRFSRGTMDSGRDARNGVAFGRPAVYTAAYTSSGGASAAPIGVQESLGLECSLCMEEFEDEGPHVPRNLQCGHTFCTGCLQQLLSRSPSGISCPRCDIATSIPGNSIERLPKNFGLLEVLTPSVTGTGSLVTGPGGTTGSPRLGRKQSRHGPSTHGPPLYCEEHGDHLSSYCVQDDVLVCSSCLLFGSHKHHNCLLVNMAAQEKRGKLAELAPDVLKQQQKMESLLTQVEEMTEKVQTSGGKLVDQLDGHFDDIIDQIDERRRILKLEIMERTQLRVQALLEQAGNLRECIAKATVTYHSATNLLRSDNYALLAGSALALGQIEGVFTNPLPTSTLANDDLSCDFSSEVRDEITSHVVGYGTVRSDVGTVKRVYVQPYHDGIRVSWDPHHYADNQGISYHLQVSPGNSEYVNIYRGGNTKFTWKTELESGVSYGFRVQVRTTEGVGNWSEPVEACQGAPAFHWHDSWRNVKIDLSVDKLEAAWSRGGVQNYWATFAGDQFLEGGQHYFEVEIVDLGRPKPNKKLAIGVIESSKSKVKSVPWHDGKYALGQWREVPSWSFHPISGKINSNSLPPTGKDYSSIQLQNGDRIGVLVDMDGQKLSFFSNGHDLGVAFEGVKARSLLPAVSIRDKIRIRLRFPPPPYLKRSVSLVRFTSTNHLF